MEQFEEQYRKLLDDAHKLKIAKRALSECYHEMKYWAVMNKRSQRIFNTVKNAIKHI